MRGNRAYYLAAICLSVASCGQRSAEQDKADLELQRTQLEERIATVINLNGHLCDKVVYVGPVLSTGEYQGEYQVNCREYGDPKKAGTKHNVAVYMVDPDQKTVRLMGRD